MGYKYIETDLRMTLDRQVIAFHDSDLKRLTKLMNLSVYYFKSRYKKS